MEKKELVRTPAVSRDGRYIFPDQTERFAHERARFDGERPVIEYIEPENTQKMRFVLDAELFQLIVEAMRVIVTEFKMMFSPEGVRIKQVDPVHVAMETIFVPKEAFREYSLDDRYLEIAVDVDSLRDLKIRKDAVTLEIERPHSERNEVKQEVEGRSLVYISRKYLSTKLNVSWGNIQRIISTLDIDSISVPRIPQISSEYYVTVPTTSVRSFTDQAVNVSDAARFTLTYDAFEMFSQNDTNEARVYLTRDELKEVSILDGEKIKIKLSIGIPGEILQCHEKIKRGQTELQGRLSLDSGIYSRTEEYAHGNPHSIPACSNNGAINFFIILTPAHARNGLGLGVFLMEAIRMSGDKNRAKEEARAQLDAIIKIMRRLWHIADCDGTDCSLSDQEIYEGLGYLYEGRNATDEDREIYHDEDSAKEELESNALSLEVRPDWHPLGDTDAPREYSILLCTGGPAVRITGNLEGDDASSAALQYQDWYTSWEDFNDMSSEEGRILLDYAQQFSFYGE